MKTVTLQYAVLQWSVQQVYFELSLNPITKKSGSDLKKSPYLLPCGKHVLFSYQHFDILILKIWSWIEDTEINVSLYEFFNVFLFFLHVCHRLEEKLFKLERKIFFFIWTYKDSNYLSVIYCKKADYYFLFHLEGANNQILLSKFVAFALRK